MSYADERDEIAELFGVEPKQKKGYSTELDRTQRQQVPPQRKQAAPAVEQSVQKSVEEKPSPIAPQSAPARKAVPAETPKQEQETVAPKKKPTVKKPVKLRPPAHVEPHPLEPVHAPPPQPVPPELPEIEDEDFLVYDDSEGTALDGADFISFDGEPDPTAVPLEKTRTEEIAEPKTRQDPAPPAKQGTTDLESIAAISAVPTPEVVGTEMDMAPARAPVSGKFLLDTNGLVKIYDGRTVVNGVDINVRPGEIVGLLGPNGAGKTTSFYMIVGLVPPNGGRVMFNGNDVTRMPMYQRARLGMGYLPQEESIFRKLTVEENIMAVMETLKIPRKEKVARCNELLERFGITHIRKNVALTCSGGEKRRVTIARSLVTRPSLLMLDEPFSGVDPIAVNEIQSIVEDLRKSGLAILITDHNARQTLELVDRAYLIYEGKVLREGHRDFLINDPVSRELYLGDQFTM